MNIFRTQDHGRRFMTCLGESRLFSGMEIHAFCLMPNHFHLLIRGTSDQLTEGMHWLGSAYSHYFNRSTRRDGPVFRSRFHCKALGSVAYILAVSRYIHRNPIGRVGSDPLEKYRWSSLQFYVGDAAPPGWLSVATILDEVGGHEAYRALMFSPNDAGQV